MLKLTVLMISFGSVACSQSAFDNGIPKAGMVPSATKSWMKVSAPNYADGSSPAEITIGVMNADGDPVPGVAMELSASGVNNTIIPCTTSDANGLSRCRLYSTRAEFKEVTALGLIKLKKDVEFEPLRPQMNSMAVVTSGDSVFLPGGQRVVSSSGIVEHDVMMMDAGGVRRVRTGILGPVLVD